MFRFARLILASSFFSLLGMCVGFVFGRVPFYAAIYSVNLFDLEHGLKTNVWFPPFE